jgi:hypothetical protein
MLALSVAAAATSMDKLGNWKDKPIQKALVTTTFQLFINVLNQEPK